MSFQSKFGSSFTSAIEIRKSLMSKFRLFGNKVRPINDDIDGPSSGGGYRGIGRSISQFNVSSSAGSSYSSGTSLTSGSRHRGNPPQPPPSPFAPFALEGFKMPMEILLKRHTSASASQDILSQSGRWYYKGIRPLESPVGGYKPSASSRRVQKRVRCPKGQRALMDHVSFLHRIALQQSNT